MLRGKHMKIAKIHRYFDADGNYSGPADYQIKVNGEQHDLFDYAKKHGIDLPVKHKTKKAKKEVNSYADLEETFNQGDFEVDGDGDSQGEE